MGDIKLTKGVIVAAMRDEELLPDTLIQVLEFKKITIQGDPDRYRLCISDDDHFCSFVLLASQLNNLIDDNTLEKFAVIRVHKIAFQIKKNQKIITITSLRVEVPGKVVGGKLGNPSPWNEIEAAGSSSGGLEANKVQLNPQHTSSSSSSDINDASVVPIRDIHLNISKVRIRARVTNKGAVKTWTNSRGTGKLFSMDLLDDTGEIRMTAFNESVDEYHGIIEPNKVYYISNFQVKRAYQSNQLTNINHDYELTFTLETEVIPYSKDASNIPSITFNFVDIAKIATVEPETIFDVIGVCKGYEDVETILERSSGKELKKTKRELTLVDKSCTEINLTLWGKNAEDFCDDGHSVIAVKGVKVREYEGRRRLSCQKSSVIQINPDLSETKSLREWYDNEGSFTMASQSFSELRRGAAGGTPWKTCSEVVKDKVSHLKKPDYFMSKVTLLDVNRRNCVYKACPSEKCNNKKVVDQGNGKFLCEKCHQKYSHFKWCIILYSHFADFTGDFWASAFQETGEKILGKNSDEVGRMYSTQPGVFDQVLKDACHQQYIGKFRSKIDTYNNEILRKIDVVELSKINHAEYSKKLLAEIQETRS